MKKPVLASLAVTNLLLSGCADFIEAASQMDRPPHAQSRATAQTGSQMTWESYERYRRENPTDHSATGIR